MPEIISDMAPTVRKPLARRDRNIPVQAPEKKIQKAVTDKEMTKTAGDESQVKVTKTTSDGGSVIEKPCSTSPAAQQIVKATAVAVVMPPPNCAKELLPSQETKASSEVDLLTALLSKTHLDAPCALPTAPLPPTRPQTAYQAFASDAWAAQRATEGSASLKEMSSKVAVQWRSAPQHVKTAYEERTREARQQYEEAKREHTGRLAVVEEERAALEFMRKKELQEEAMAFFLKYRGTINQASEPKKDEATKPKAPRTAYNFFVTRRREELASEGEKLSVGDVAKEIAEDWKKIQVSRKKKDKQVVAECHALAGQDQNRHQKEMDEYKRSVEESERKKAAENEEYRKRALEAYRSEMQDKEDAKAYRKLMAKKATQEREDDKAARIVKANEKAAKEPGPKRARNAYMFYFAAKSKDDEVRQLAEREGKSVAAVVSEMWKKCDGEEKAQYQDMASVDKKRYAEEVGAKQEATQTAV